MTLGLLCWVKTIWSSLITNNVMLHVYVSPMKLNIQVFDWFQRILIYISVLYHCLVRTSVVFAHVSIFIDTSLYFLGVCICYQTCTLFELFSRFYGCLCGFAKWTNKGLTQRKDWKIKPAQVQPTPQNLIDVAQCHSCCSLYILQLFFSFGIKILMSLSTLALK